MPVSKTKDIHKRVCLLFYTTFPKIQHGHLIAVSSLLLAKWRYTLSTTKTHLYIAADVRPK